MMDPIEIKFNLKNYKILYFTYITHVQWLKLRFHVVDDFLILLLLIEHCIFLYCFFYNDEANSYVDYVNYKR